MSSLRMQSKMILHALAAMLLFTAMAAAQISGLCNTGQTPATASGCTGVLVPVPNSARGQTPNLDGNWGIGYPSPSTLRGNHTPCSQESFVVATVDTPNGSWLANSASAASEWILPDGGATDLPPANPAGSPGTAYIYRTRFPVPSVLPSGVVPTSVTINGQLASDNSTYWIYLESPVHSTECALVSGQKFPVNPPGGPEFSQWLPFSFSNSIPLTPGADAYLYFVVENGMVPGYNGSSTGLRVEFFASSAFN